MSKTTPVPGHKRGKKPVHLLSALGYHTPQDCAWEAIRALQQFRLNDIEKWLMKKGREGINPNTVRSYIDRLKKGAFIAVVDNTNTREAATTPRYELIKDVGIRAPRLTKDGNATTLGLGRENLWRSMKILNSFDYKDLIQAAITETVSIKQGEAKDYIKCLYKAGYLQLIKASSQKTRTPARYRLLASKNTGPRPPMIQRIKQVFDPNLNRVMWSQDEGIR